MDKRYRPPRFTYLVKWVSYDQPSPKPLENLDHCQDLVQEFYTRHPSKPCPVAANPPLRPRHVRTRQVTSEHVIDTSSHA
jgi:hypothetical protein